MVKKMRLHYENDKQQGDRHARLRTAHFNGQAVNTSKKYENKCVQHKTHRYASPLVYTRKCIHLNMKVAV